MRCREVSSQTIGRRALNRALLGRQLLLERAEMTAEQAIEHLVGMQAQAPNTPYVGLWSRLAGFQFDELAQLMRNREVARLVLMRSTIHLVTASDAHCLRTLLQPMLEQRFRSSTHSKLLGALNTGTVAAMGRAVVDTQPHTFAELGSVLAQRWPDYDPSALAQFVRTYVPLVQVPPRGVWGEGGMARHVSTEAWLGPPVGAAVSLEESGRSLPGGVWSGQRRRLPNLVRAYPHARNHGTDRTATDQTSGTTMASNCSTSPTATRPDPETPAPVRFLPEFDNLALSHADRPRIVSDDDRKTLATPNGIIPGSVLVDGFVHASWKITRLREEATITISPLRRLSKKNTSSVLAEGRRLLVAAAAASPAHRVVVDVDPPAWLHDCGHQRPLISSQLGGEPGSFSPALGAQPIECDGQIADGEALLSAAGHRP